MKLLVSVLISSIAFSLFSSCGGHPGTVTETTDSLRTICIAPETKTLTQSQVFDSIRIVQLETTGKNLIGEVTSLMFTDSLMVVMDKYTQSIQVYDRNGHFLRRVGRQGQSGNEYIEIAAAALTPDAKQVAVADVRRRKSLFYGLSDGSFIGSEELPYNILGMQYIHGGDSTVLALYSPLGADEKQASPTLIVAADKTLTPAYEAFPSLMSLSQKFTFS